MSKPQRTPAQWGEVYAGERELYVAYAKRLRSVLIELLEAEGLDYVQVDARAKTQESFVEKINRRPGKYQDPLNDITDLAGVRVVVYYQSDLERVDALVEREFAIDGTNSWQGRPTADPDRFGYASDHYVIGPSEVRASLGEWTPYADLRAELQVRTVLQHAWAAIDHKLNYKRANEIPSELKRQLFRISALLEVGDSQFEAVRVAAEHLDTAYEESVAAGDLAIPVDRSSIEAYVENSPRLDRLSELAADIGFEVRSSYASDEATSDALDDASESIPDLTQACQVEGLESVAELDSFLHAASAWDETALLAMRSSVADGWMVTPAFLASSLLWIGSRRPAAQIGRLTDSAEFYVRALRAARRAIKVRGDDGGR